MPFDKALKDTLKDEGGYVHDPLDSGGETFRGVSRVSNPNWPGWKLIDKAKKEVGVRTIKKYWTTIDEYFKDHKEMEALVAAVYRDKYYEPFNI